MSRCVLCGESIFGAGDLCGYHTPDRGEDWSASNRVMCNFIHRGIVPPAESDAEARIDELEPVA